MTTEKQLTMSNLIQLNQEASAIHTIALLMERVDIKTFTGSLSDQRKIEDKIEHTLEAYESIGLNKQRIAEEAYKLCKMFRISYRKDKLNLQII